MSEYYKVLEEFKEQHKDKILKNYGSIEKYDEFINKCRSKEEEIAKIAIKKYGSIKEYVKAVRNNLLNSTIDDLEQGINNFKEECLGDKNPRIKELFEKLIVFKDNNPSDKEVQYVAKAIEKLVKEEYEVFLNL